MISEILTELIFTFDYFRSAIWCGICKQRSLFATAMWHFANFRWSTIDFGCSWRILKKEFQQFTRNASAFVPAFCNGTLSISEKAAMAATIWQQEPDENDMVQHITFFHRNLRSVSTLIALWPMMQCSTTCTVMSMRRHHCRNCHRRRRRRCYWRA